MKKIIFVSLASLMFTGCAQMQHSLKVSMLSPTERAKYDCIQFGFKVDTPDYARCVQQTTANIRSVRAQEYTASQSAANSASAQAERNRIKTVSCRQVGSSIVCNEY
jgi:hypothetical protein